MERINKRLPPPNSESLRNDISKQIITLKPRCPQKDDLCGLEIGNKKTGVSGKFYDSVWVWNLPAFVTCPGHTQWCSFNCYNADIRTDVYNHDLWCENWWLFLNSPSELKRTICEKIDNNSIKTAIRIHSSGDFFSIEYCKFWRDIIAEFPSTVFWSYTRSWRVSNLKEELLKMSVMDNFSLYASVDEMVDDQMIDLPKSRVFPNYSEMKSFSERYGGFICPEQFGIVASCADCGFCMRNREQDVLFLLH